MGVFAGSATSSKVGSHYFYIDKLLDVGMSIISAADFMSVKDDITARSYITGAGMTINSQMTDIYDFFTQNGVTNFSYQKQKHDGTFTSANVSLASLEGLIGYADGASPKTRSTHSDQKEKTIHAINCSEHNRLYAYSGTCGNVYCYFTKIVDPDVNRQVALRTTTIFSGIPRRSSGAKYSAEGEDVGVYEGRLLTDLDYRNHVAAPLKLKYNHNLHKFESSCVYLCCLLEDIDAAEIVSPSLSPSDLSIDSSEFYGGDLNSISAFTTGQAMPLAVQKNNPHAFGPNFVDYNNEIKIEKIRVVNRSLELFNKGEIAMVAEIDGENILVKLSRDQVVAERPPKFEGQWEFAKFMASSDSYFRNSSTNGRLLPLEAAHLIYSKFYSGAQGGFKYCHQTTIHEMMLDTNGGAIDSSLYSKNAYSSRISVKDGIPQYYDIPTQGSDDAITLFWGPCFPDGFVGQGLGLPAEIGINGNESRIQDMNQVRVKANALDGTLATKKELSNLRFNNIFEPVGSGFEPNQPNTVQFSLLSAELLGHKDTNANSLDTDNLVFDSEKNVRKFKARCIELTQYGGYVSLYRDYSASTSINAANQHLWSSAPNSDYFGVPYDNYVQLEPFSPPLGAYAMFGGDGGKQDGTPFEGANAVGVTSGRRLVRKSGGQWNLNVSTTQQFGTQGRFYGGGFNNSFNVGLGAIGFGLSLFVQDLSTPKIISGVTRAWGAGDDMIQDFGTAALHVQVWDGWPREDTLWLPQYFTPLHFNPGSLDTGVSTETYKANLYNPATEEYEEKNVEYGIVDTIVDYRVPTYGPSIDANGNLSHGSTVPIDTAITSSTSLKAPEYWNVVTGCRGQLVTLEGYEYTRLVIGVGSSTIDDGGSGFTDDEIYDLGKGLKIKITASSGEITGITYASEEIEGSDGINTIMRGDSFMPEDFPFTATIKGGGSDATIRWDKGKVLSKTYWNYGPKPQSPMTRVSLPSTHGQKRVEGEMNTQIPIESNYESPYAGLYEIFTHCHNDVGITLHNEPHSTTGDQVHSHITASFS